MKPGALRSLIGIPIVCLSLAACAGAPAPPEPPASPPPVAPEVSKAEPAPPRELDPQRERLLVKDLLRDVDAYHRLLQEKNVERAAMYVPQDERLAFRDDLWEFVARYQLQSADLVSYQLIPEPDGLLVAKVRVQRTLFEKYSVVPQKSEIQMTWENRGDRWTLRPQEDE